MCWKRTNPTLFFHFSDFVYSQSLDQKWQKRGVHYGFCSLLLFFTRSQHHATIQIKWRNPNPQEANSPISVWLLTLREILNTFWMFSKNALSRIGSVHKSSAFLVLLPYIHRDIIESTFLQLCLRRRRQDRQLFVLDFWGNSHSASANQTNALCSIIHLLSVKNS